MKPIAKEAHVTLGSVLTAHREILSSPWGADCCFKMTSCGYVGVNDGWQDFIRHRRLPLWNYDCVFNGNIALTGEIDRKGGTEFILAVAFSRGDDGRRMPH